MLDSQNSNPQSPPEGWQPINVDDLFKVIGEQAFQIRILQTRVAQLELQSKQETNGVIHGN